MPTAAEVVRILRQVLASEATHSGRAHSTRVLFEKRRTELQLPLWRKQIVEWLWEVRSQQLTHPPGLMRGGTAGC